MTVENSPCAEGHLTPPGSSFCTRCGAAVISSDVPEPPIVPPVQSPQIGYRPAPQQPKPPVQQPVYYQAQAPYGGYPPTQPPHAYAPVDNRATNGMAIASMILGIVWIYWIGSVLALIFGYIALSQIKQRNESGRGMALAGVVLGWVGVGILLLVIIAGAASNNNS